MNVYGISVPSDVLSLQYFVNNREVKLRQAFFLLHIVERSSVRNPLSSKHHPELIDESGLWTLRSTETAFLIDAPQQK